MKTSEKIEQLIGALVEAQGEFTAPTKNKEVDAGKYVYSYADLADVIETIKPVMKKHGLSVIQVPSKTAEGFFLYTRLMHKSGEWIESQLPLSENRSPQELGSQMTYMRRYSLCGIVGIAAEDDDDGRAAEDGAKGAGKQAAPKGKPPVQPKVKANEAPLDPTAPASKAHRAAMFATMKGLFPKMATEEAVEFLTKATGKVSSAEWINSDLDKIMKAFEAKKKADAEKPAERQPGDEDPENFQNFVGK